MPSHYNLFVGTENGLFKGVNTLSQTFNNLNLSDELNKDKEILQMCWADQDKQDQVYFATRDQHLLRYTTDAECTSPFEDLGQLSMGEGLVRGLDCFAENRILSCTQNGSLKVWEIEPQSGDSKLPSQLLEHTVGSDIHCVKRNPFESNLFATGGKENDLKLWDVNNMASSPVFKAKNVPDNWVRLREAVWVTCVDFFSQNKIVVGTGHHQVRVYDSKTGVRRPVVNLNYGAHPITTIIALSDGNRLIVSNTIGDMEMVDLRVATAKQTDVQCVKKYKNFQGTIKSAQLIQKPNEQTMLLAACGLDRYVRVYNVETSKLQAKFFLKSRLNCLLFSKNEPIKTAKSSENKTTARADDEISLIQSEDLGTDDLWSDMEQVVDDHPNLAKRRLKDFSDSDEEDEDDDEEENFDENDKAFKKPKLQTMTKPKKQQKTSKNSQKIKRVK